MKDILKAQKIKPEDFKNMLGKLQANILKSHGRNHTAILLLEFHKNAIEKVRKLLSELKITSAYEQWRTTEKRNAWKGDPLKNPKPKSNILLNLHLSNKGYQKLKVPSSQRPKDAAFRDGMAQRDLTDIPLNEWENCFHKGIDGMLFLASDDPKLIEQQIEKLQKNWLPFIDILHIQLGQKLVNDHNQCIEHFGYVDGISQPLFFESDFKNVQTNIWKPETPLGLALVKDPGVQKPDCYGSYLVYRKLEQNVKAFKEAETALAKDLGLAGEAEEMAGALMVGRFEHGLPIIRLGTTPTNIPSNANDFDYAHDPDGQRCPFQAHIRKANPRGDSVRAFQVSEASEHTHRIVRRGIPYDDIGRNGQLSVHPEGGVGLLFMCFQSNIQNQFEFIQKFWMNNNDFPRPFTGIDPITGQGENRVDANGKDAEQKWPSIHQQTRSKSLADFVHLRGGEYFFTPSIPFIQSLDESKNSK